jgi:hypothetical protein
MILWARALTDLKPPPESVEPPPPSTPEDFQRRGSGLISSSRSLVSSPRESAPGERRERRTSTFDPIILRKGAGSPQQTDHEPGLRIQAAFSRLVRLRQVGVDIEAAAVVDNTIQEKQALTAAARGRLQKSREDQATAASDNLTEVIARNNLENREISRARRDVVERTTRQRNERSQRMRALHRALVTRAEDAREFSFSFLSTAHHMAILAERSRQVALQQKERAVAAEAATKAKRANAEAELASRRVVAEVKQQKAADARFAKFLLDQKRDKMKKIGEARRTEVAHLHGIDRDRAKTALSKVRDSRYHKPADEPQPVVDEIELAAKSLEMSMGVHLGETESHMMTSFITGLLES